MKKLEIYEPGGCDSGKCSPEIEKELVRMEKIIQELREKGVSVSRFNIIDHGPAFLENEVVKNTLEAEGLDCLPLVLSEGKIESREEYPSDMALAKWGGLPWSDLEIYAEREKRGKTVLLVPSGPGCDTCGG